MVGKFTDGTGTIDLIWFKGLNYVTEKIKPGVDYIVFGKPTEFGPSRLILKRGKGAVGIEIGGEICYNLIKSAVPHRECGRRGGTKRI